MNKIKEFKKGLKRGQGVAYHDKIYGIYPRKLKINFLANPFFAFGFKLGYNK